MRLAIIGFGKMGNMIYEIAKQQGHEIVSIVDPFSEDDKVTSRKLDVASLSKADVAIDFSHPVGIFENIKFYISNGIPCVIGTTGWYDREKELRNFAKNYPQSSLIFSGNFSIGVSLYREVVRLASSLFGKTGSYDVFMNEIHHRGKADSPSGTAKLIADVVEENFDSKDAVVTERLDRKRLDNEIHVSSTRGGWVPGTHTVVFDSPFDTIELVHRARTREGFATGAVLAASWIKNRKGFYTLDDFVDTLIKG